jgi:hypothetical protein
LNFHLSVSYESQKKEGHPSMTDGPLRGSQFSHRQGFSPAGPLRGSRCLRI